MVSDGITFVAIERRARPLGIICSRRRRVWRGFRLPSWYPRKRNARTITSAQHRPNAMASLWLPNAKFVLFRPKKGRSDLGNELSYMIFFKKTYKRLFFKRDILKIRNSRRSGGIKKCSEEEHSREGVARKRSAVLLRRQPS